MLIASEAGELLAEVRWISGDESDQMLTNPDVRTRVEHEIADIMIGVLIFCDRVGIDLWQAVEEKIEINNGNYPPNQRGTPTRKKS
jgi:NTP pyrophosphatase (non-canonical NTP hydrolase)